MSTNHRGVPYLCQPYIPAGGIVLLNGPPSAGKSQLLWQLLNAVQDGGTFLDRPTAQGNALLLNLDMYENALWHRWKATGLEPHFDLVVSEPFNCMRMGWQRSELVQSLAAMHQQRQYTCVAIDALAEVHGTTASNDAAPTAVYGAFRALFPGATLLFNHHDRKRGRTEFGIPSARSDEDALGTQMWKALATVALHLYPADEFLVSLDMTKSQVGAIEDAALLVRMDNGALLPWTFDNQWKLAQEFIALLARVRNKNPRRERDVDVMLEELYALPHDVVANNVTRHQLRRMWTAWVATNGGRRQ